MTMIEFALFGSVAFLSGFIVDFLWTLYLRCVVIRRKILAATYSTLIGFCSIVMIETLLHNVWYCSFWLIGLFFGTITSFKINIEEKNVAN